MTFFLRSRLPAPADLIPALRNHRWFVGTAIAAVLVFGWILTGGTGRLFEPELLGDFYDYQAASLLRGRLDVPVQAVFFEAFVFGGKYYGYFGITPALLRIPFVLPGIAFGQLSRLFMLGYFASALVASYLVLLEVTRASRQGRAAPTPGAVVLFLGNVGLGSTLLFLSSRAYVYHEAILCGAMFALWGVWFALRYLANAGSRWWIGSLVCGILALHARPPAGLFALTFLALIATRHLFQAWRRRGRTEGGNHHLHRQPLAIAALSIIGLLTFPAVSYLKFKTFEGCPLRLNVQYTAERLAKIDGRQFHLANIPFNAAAYLFAPSVSVEKYFPYIHIEEPKSRPAGARLDLVEPIAGVPFTMAGVFVLAAFGSLFGLVQPGPHRPVLITLWLAVLPVFLSMTMAIAVSHRYTADFAPFLIGSAACAFAYRPDSRYRSNLLAPVAAVLTVAGIGATLAATLEFQGERLWGVPEQYRRNYAGLREKVDGWFGQRNPSGYDSPTLPIRRMDLTCHLWMAGALFETGQWDSGISIYERFLRDSSAAADIHLTVAEIYAERKRDVAKAIGCAALAVRADARSANARRRLGDFLMDANRVQEAIENYRAALELQPNFAIAHNNFARALASIGRRAEALQHVEQALAIDPNYREAQINLEKLRASTGGAK